MRSNDSGSHEIVKEIVKVIKVYKVKKITVKILT